MARRTRRRVLTAARLRRHLGAAGLLIALVLTACGVERTLDAGQLEADINDQLLTEYPGAIRSVSCPDIAEPTPGQSVLCVASLGAQVIDVNVMIGGVEDALTTTATVNARFVAVNEVAALLGATFGDEIGLVTSVDCGQAVVVLEPNDSVVCNATDPSGITRSFDVYIADNGLISLALR